MPYYSCLYVRPSVLNQNTPTSTWRLLFAGLCIAARGDDCMSPRRLLAQKPSAHAWLHHVHGKIPAGSFYNKNYCLIYCDGDASTGCAAAVAVFPDGTRKWCAWTCPLPITQSQIELFGFCKAIVWMAHIALELEPHVTPVVLCDNTSAMDYVHCHAHSSITARHKQLRWLEHFLWPLRSKAKLKLILFTKGPGKQYNPADLLARKGKKQHQPMDLPDLLFPLNSTSELPLAQTCSCRLHDALACWHDDSICTHSTFDMQWRRCAPLS